MVTACPGAVAVFLVAHAGFERAEHAELAFDRDAAEMRHVGDVLGDADVVVPVVAGVLPSAAGEPSIITEVKPAWIAVAGGFVVAVVEMHADGICG